MPREDKGKDRVGPHTPEKQCPSLRNRVTIPASLSRKLAIHKGVQAEHRLKIGMSGKRTISCSVLSSEPRYRFLTLHIATSDRYWKDGTPSDSIV